MSEHTVPQAPKKQFLDPVPYRKLDGSEDLIAKGAKDLRKVGLPL